MKKPRKAKKLAYLVVDRFGEAGRALYAVLDDLIEQHHQELTDARIALAWNLSWSPDVDGRVTLGKCKKASDLDRELAQYDFVLLLQQKFFADPLTTDLQKRALIDHELTHATVAYDTDGEPIVDQRGRTVYRTRRHDLEEFSEIVDRYGCWKKDLEAFAMAMTRARSRAEGWIGFERVRDSLHVAGADVPIETIGRWTEHERRDAEVWARLQIEIQRLGLDIEAQCPAHVMNGMVNRQREAQAEAIASPVN